MCYLNADKGPRANQVLHFLPRLASKDDIVVMNVVRLSSLRACQAAA